MALTKVSLKGHTKAAAAEVTAAEVVAEAEAEAATAATVIKTAAEVEDEARGGYNNRNGDRGYQQGGRGQDSSSGRPSKNAPCPFHKKPVKQQQGGFPSWHSWGDCASNVFSNNFDAEK